MLPTLATFTLTLYVLMYKIGNKLHNLKCNILRFISEFYIIRYVFFT